MNAWIIVRGRLSSGKRSCGGRQTKNADMGYEAKGTGGGGGVSGIKI